jgi:hypothetical protein
MKPAEAPALKPFRSEVAGWFDGVAVNLAEAHSSDRMVLAHEEEHANIFIYTPDGSVLAALFNVRQLIKDEHSRLEAEHAIARAMASSELSQEANATYVGIKLQMTEAERERAYASLPPEYRAYYKTFADLFDRLTPSTYLQVCFARAASSAIFSSRAFQRWADSGFDCAALGQPAASADHRLGVFVDWWRNGGETAACQLVANELRSSATLRQFAFPNDDASSPFGRTDDDEHWLKEHGQQSSIVEKTLILLLYEYFLSALPLESLSFNSDAYMLVLDKLRDYYRGFGVVLRTSRSTIGAVSEAEIETAFRTAISTRLHLTPADRPAVQTTITQTAADRLPEGGEVHISFCVSRNWLDGEPSYIKILKGHEGQKPKSVEVFECGVMDVITYLSDFMYQRSGRLTQTRLSHVLAPYYSDPRPENDRILIAMLYMHPAVPQLDESNNFKGLAPQILLQDQEIFWYSDNYLYNLLLPEQGGISRYYLLPLKFAGSERSFLLNIVQVPGRFGFYMKAVPSELTGAIVRFYDHMASNGKIAPIDDEYAQRVVAPRAIAAFRSALTFWDYL